MPDGVAVGVVVAAAVVKKRLADHTWHMSNNPASARKIEECHRNGINIVHRNGGVTYVQSKPYADYETGGPRSLVRWTDVSGPSWAAQTQWNHDFFQLQYWLDRR